MKRLYGKKLENTLEPGSVHIQMSKILLIQECHVTYQN